MVRLVPLEHFLDRAMIGCDLRRAMQRDNADRILWQQVLPHELDGAVERIGGVLNAPKPSTSMNVRRVAGVSPGRRAPAIEIAGSSTGPGSSR